MEHSEAKDARCSITSSMAAHTFAREPQVIEAHFDNSSCSSEVVGYLARICDGRDRRKDLQFLLSLQKDLARTSCTARLTSKAD